MKKSIETAAIIISAIVVLSVGMVHGELVYNLNPEVDTYSMSSHWDSRRSRPFTQYLDQETLQVRYQAWNRSIS